MSPATRHQSVFFLILRRMRMPLILLITIMAISVFGLTLMPGVDADGQPRRLNFFEAFYFVSYTATTIGFGEIPYAFSPQQRLWVIVTIYLSVVGWTFTLGKLIGLLSDRNLRQAIAMERFARAVHITAAVDVAACRATMRQGELTLSLPKINGGRETIIPVEKVL